MKHTKRKLRSITAAVMAVCLLAAPLTACGGDKSSGDTEEGGTVASTSGTAGKDPAGTEPGETLDVPGAEGCLVPSVYPIPLYMSVAAGKEASAVALSAVSLDENAEKFSALLTKAGASLEENGLPVTVIYRDLSSDFEYGADEAYILTIREGGITVEAQTERGAFYAMTTLCSLTENGRAPSVTVKDAPRNPQRGVIEGFYGKAYTHEFRKELFAFMGENKMNAYIYAPKDDPKHRAQWRDLYTGTELDIMTDLIASARENYVKFIYAISPGGDINLGSGYEADFQKLMAKCQQMYDLGVRDFAVFLDDIPTLDAEGHAKLLNDFQTKFVETHEGVSNLVAITTEYTDFMLTEYTDTIAPLLHKDIELMWTGPGVSPEKITNPLLRKILRKYEREVFIWWNYPVNDILVNNLYMDACRGLTADLHESITGLVSNPMNQGYASMVPLFTTADYLWNPEQYDPDVSLQAACEALVPDVAEAMLHFIAMTGASPMNKYIDSTALKSLLNAYKNNRSEESTAALRAYFEQMVANADLLARMENQAIYNDIADWVFKYRAYGVMGMAYLDMETAYEEGKPLNEIRALLGTYKDAEASIRHNARLVSEKVLTVFLNTLQTRLDELCGFGGETPSVALPTFTSNLSAYDNYLPNLACDGMEGTYFWSSSGGREGDYFQLDLGAVMRVSSILFRARSVTGETDYVQNGELSYSADGSVWTKLSDVCSPEVSMTLDVEARYFRVTLTAAQTNWITVSEFSAGADFQVSDALWLDEYFIPRFNLMLLQDGRGTTVFPTPDASADGHTLSIRVGETGKVQSLAVSLPAEGVSAVVQSADGVELERIPLQYNTEIRTSAGAIVTVPLGGGLLLAEIQ